MKSWNLSGLTQQKFISHLWKVLFGGFLHGDPWTQTPSSLWLWHPLGTQRYFLPAGGRTEVLVGGFYGPGPKSPSFCLNSAGKNLITWPYLTAVESGKWLRAIFLRRIRNVFWWTQSSFCHTISRHIAKHRSSYLILIIEAGTVIIPFYRKGNWGSERKRT